MSAGALAGALFFGVVPVGAAPVAGAQPCADVEVVFARGTSEPVGVGGVGQAFVDAVTARAGGRSVTAYAVNYPANYDFSASTVAGARDASAHIQATAADCPNTQIVLGGFSQGAGVIDLASTDLPAGVTDKVAAVADFGGPRTLFAQSLSPGALPVISPALADRYVDMCVVNDPICFEGGSDMGAHNAYIQMGLVDQAADFVAARL